jgi:hypothetical protein
VSRFLGGISNHSSSPSHSPEGCVDDFIGPLRYLERADYTWPYGVMSFRHRCSLSFIISFKFGASPAQRVSCASSPRAPSQRIPARASQDQQAVLHLDRGRQVKGPSGGNRSSRQLPERPVQSLRGGLMRCPRRAHCGSGHAHTRRPAHRLAAAQQSCQRQPAWPPANNGNLLSFNDTHSHLPNRKVSSTKHRNGQVPDFFNYYANLLLPRSAPLGSIRAYSALRQSVSWPGME